LPTRLEVLEKLAARGGADPFPTYALALEYRSAGRDDDAAQTFERLRAAHPGYVPQYLIAGQLLQKLGRLEAAREWLSEGVSRASTARDAHALGELQSALAGLP
jgi:hypothetical protein